MSWHAQQDSLMTAVGLVQSSKRACAGSRARLLIPSKLPRADARASLTLRAISGPEHLQNDTRVQIVPTDHPISAGERDPRCARKRSATSLILIKNVSVLVSYT